MLLSFTSFLLLFYFISEIIFCSWLFNLGQKMVYTIVVVRLLLGVAIGVGTVLAMNFSVFKLESFGILFILVGANIMLYVPVMKEKKWSEVQYTFDEPS